MKHDLSKSLNCLFFNHLKTTTMEELEQISQEVANAILDDILTLDYLFN